MINNKIIILFLMLPLLGYGDPIGLDEHFTAGHSDQLNGLVATLKDNTVDNNVSPLIVEPEKVVEHVDVVQDQAENLNLKVSETVVEEQVSEETKEKEPRFKTTDESLLEKAFPLPENTDVIKDNKVITDHHGISRHYSKDDMQLLQKIFDGTDDVQVQNNTSRLTENDLVLLEKAFSEEKTVDDQTQVIKGETRYNVAALQMWLNNRPFACYGIGFFMGLAVYSIASKLYAKYGNQWKKAFNLLIRFCRNKSC